MDTLLTMRNYQRMLDKFVTSIVGGFLGVNLVIALGMLVLAVIVFRQNRTSPNAIFLVVEDVLLVFCYGIALLHLRVRGCLELIQHGSLMRYDPQPSKLVQDFWVFVLLMAVQLSFALYDIQRCQDYLIIIHHYAVFINVGLNVLALGIGIGTLSQARFSS